MAWRTVSLLLVALAAGVHARRNLLVTIDSDTQGPDEHREIDYNPATDGPFAYTDLTYITTPAMGLTPEQVSVNYWAPGAYLISWVTGSAQVGLGLSAPDVSRVASTVNISTDPEFSEDVMTFEGTALSYHYNYSGIPEYHLLDYQSGVIHHTNVSGLASNTTYFYQVGDERYAVSKVYNFTTLPDSFPLKVSVMADTGQTPNSSATLDHLLGFNKPQLVLNIGDLSYADTYNSRGTIACWLASGTYDAYSGPPYNNPGGGRLSSQCLTNVPPTKVESPDTYQPRFDSWARLFEKVLAYVPAMHTNGNHEIDTQADGTMFEAYNARYPQPQDPSILNTNPVSYFSDQADDNLYSAAEIPGIATVVMLTSLQPQLTFGSAADKQFTWLEAKLKAIDRTKTPWLIVGFHVPIYTSEPRYFKLNECFRQTYEPLFFKYGVDIIFNGHVHAYERFYPAYNWTRNDCGPINIVVGSGGNEEGLAATPKGWLDKQAANISFCSNPESRQFASYQPQRCFSYQPEFATYANYCPDKQPDIEAFRQTAFGSGLLTIESATKATWEWHSNLAGVHEVVDQVTITRTPETCLKPE